MFIELEGHSKKLKKTFANTKQKWIENAFVFRYSKQRKEPKREAGKRKPVVKLNRIYFFD